MDKTRQLREDAAACDFVAQFLDDREQGIARDLADYQSCFPDFRDRIAVEYAALLTGDAAPLELPPEFGRDVGPYRLLEQLGHGGQGIVFRAEHRELKRIVALKMLHHGALGLSAAHRARLRREAITVARLDHPAICPIYEVELEGPEPYLAMRLVPGRSLASALDQARQQRSEDLALPPRTRPELEAWLAFFEGAAAGLHAAHRTGIVHRDVKPHNLMRTPAGDPVLLDFGLARDATSTSGALTGTQELFGTLAYMAPELLSERVEPNPQHDVYALGVSLYEALTLRQPFDAATPEVLWRKITSGDATSARSLNSNVPRDLDVVLATALEREPTRRYLTAQALAEDLRRLRLREPILARPLSRMRRTTRWVRKHPALSAMFALLTIGILTVSHLYSELRRANTTLEHTNERLKLSIGDLTSMELASQALRTSETDAAVALIDAVEAARAVRNPHTSNILMQVLDRCYTESRMFCNNSLTETISVNATGDLVAMPCKSGKVQVFRVSSGSRVKELSDNDSDWAYTAFGGIPDSLLVAGGDATLRAFDTTTFAFKRAWKAPPSDPTPVPSKTTSLAVSPDRRTVARGDAAGCVDIINLADGQVRRWRAHTNNVSFASFSPNGEQLLTFSKDHPDRSRGDFRVTILDAGTGVIKQSFGPHPGANAPRCAAWSPDGQWIGVSHDDGEIQVLDVVSGRPVSRLLRKFSGEGRFVTFDPKGERLWTCSLDGLVVLDCKTGHELRRIDDFGGRVPEMIRFSPDGAWAAVIGRDSTLRIYDSENVSLRTKIKLSPSSCVCWTPDNLRLVTQHDGHGQVFCIERGFLPDLPGHRDAARQVHFDNSGNEVLSASKDGSARIWAVTGGRSRSVLPHDSPLLTARFSADAKRVLTTCEAGPAQLWDRNTLGKTPLGTTKATEAWFFDNDHQIVTIDEHGWLRGYDESGTELFSERVHSPREDWQGREMRETKIWSSAWHPSMPWLATGAGDRIVSIYDCLAREEKFRLSAIGDPEDFKPRVLCLAFSADGHSFAAGIEDQSVHCWTLSPNLPVATIKPGPTPGFVVFEREGTHLAVGARLLGSVRCEPWPRSGSVRTGNPAIHSAPNAISSLRLDASGELLLCTDKAGHLNVFRTTKVAPTSDQPRWQQILSVRVSDVPVMDANFSPDSKSIVTGDANGRVRIWPVDPLPIAEAAIPKRPPPQSK